jgi:hypothetical protein
MEAHEWNREKVLDLLDRSDKAVWRAVHRIYQNQTTAERAMEATVEQNGVGFNGADAELLTSFAKQYERKGWLSPKQTALARKKVKKYTRQLLAAIGN